MSEQETWYKMADGSVGDPLEIFADENGKLFHKDGRAVAYNDHGPIGRGVSTEDVKAARTKKKPKESVEEPKETAKTEKDMQPEEQKSGYKTRETKSRK